MKKLSLFLLSLCLFACESKDEETIQTIDKNGSIVVVASTKHLNDLLDVSTFTISYYKGGQLLKTTEVNDTISSLGKTSEVLENEEGETKQVMIPKEYKVYVTLK